MRWPRCPNPARCSATRRWMRSCAPWQASSRRTGCSRPTFAPRRTSTRRAARTTNWCRATTSLATISTSGRAPTTRAEVAAAGAARPCLVEHAMEAGEAPALAIDGLTKRFFGTLALDRVDLALVRGEIHALIGENGAGKSTLIKCLAGIYPADG